MKYGKRLTLGCIALVVSSSLQAQTLIKSVDQAGNVTYSEKIATDAVSSSEVAITPGPAEDQVNEAKQRAKRTRDYADQAQAEREALAEKRREATELKAEQQPELIEERNNPATIRPRRYKSATALPSK